MTAKHGATWRFITPAVISRGRSGVTNGNLTTQTITHLSCVPPMAKATSRNGKKIAAHSPASPASTKSSYTSRLEYFCTLAAPAPGGGAAGDGGVVQRCAMARTDAAAFPFLVN